MPEFKITNLNNLLADSTTITDLDNASTYRSVATGVLTGNGLGPGYISAGTGAAISIGGRQITTSFTGIYYVPFNVPWTGSNTNLTFNKIS
jgi:hypothetical protein